MTSFLIPLEKVAFLSPDTCCIYLALIRLCIMIFCCIATKWSVDVADLNSCLCGCRQLTSLTRGCKWLLNACAKQCKTDWEELGLDS